AHCSSSLRISRSLVSNAPLDAQLLSVLNRRIILSYTSKLASVLGYTICVAMLLSTTCEIVALLLGDEAKLRLRSMSPVFRAMAHAVLLGIRALFLRSSTATNAASIACRDDVKLLSN